jgi:hypothetical protein
MILFVPKILDHMQIKTLIFFCLFWFYNSTTYIKKVQTPNIPFYYVFLIHPYVITKNKNLKQNKQHITQIKKIT